MLFKTNIKVGARFKLIVRKSDEQRLSESAWSDNLVLDAGLDAMAGVGSAAISHVWVGSGNSAPVPSQVSLDNAIAGTSTTQGSDQSGLQVSALPYYYFCKRTFRFPLGASAGNLSEVGLGNGAGSLFNRALIRDSSGNPTSITVLADEILDVLVELRVYPSTNFSGQFQLLNKFDEVVSAHDYAGNAVLHNNGIAWSVASVRVDLPLLAARVMANSVNPLNTSYPNTTGAVTKSMSQSRPNNRALIGLFTLGLNEGNDWDHKGILIPIANLLSKGDSSALIGYKWDIDPPIPKSNQQTLRYMFELTWDRYTP